MTDTEKTMNTMTALTIAGISTNPPTAELIWRVREALTQKGESLTLGEIRKIQEKVAEAHQAKEKSKSNLLVPR